MRTHAISLAAALLGAAVAAAIAQPGSLWMTLFSVPLAPPPVYPSSRAPSIECPPPQFSSIQDFNVTAYISAPWYVQQQVPLSYQPPEQLYCVKAEYELRDNRTLQAGLVVNNYANKGEVNGPTVGSSKYDRTSGPRLIALPATRPPNNATDGKLLVGPELLLVLLPGDLWRTAFGPYWVVAVGPSANATLQYDWAIVSGGAPIYPVAGAGCSTLPLPGSSGGGPGTGGSGGAAGYGGAPVGAYGGMSGGKGGAVGMGPYGGAGGYGGGSGVVNGGVSGAYGGPAGGGVGGAYGGPAGGGVGGAHGGGAPLRIPGGPATGPAAGGGGPNGGRPNLTPYEKGGLWLLARKPVDPDATTAMRARAKQMGLDISGLLPVAQEGCRYQA